MGRRGQKYKTKPRKGTKNTRRAALNEVLRERFTPETSTHTWQWIEGYSIYEMKSRTALCTECGLQMIILHERERGGVRGWHWRPVWGGDENGIGGLLSEPRCQGRPGRRFQ